MAYAKDSKRKEIILCHLDIRKDRKGVVSVRFLSDGMKTRVVHDVTINSEQSRFVDLG